MQALEFEAAAILGHLDDGGDGQRIVGGELRIDDIAQIEKLARAGEIGEIRGRLAGVYRIAFKATFLGALDLGVPIGALDQPHHHSPAMFAAEAGDMINHLRRAFLIGLDRQPETVPAGKRRIGERVVDNVKRQFQPVHLLGVDGEVEIMRLGHLRQLDQIRHQLFEHLGAMGRQIARVQRRELDRNARTVRQLAPGGHLVGRLADGRDGIGIGLEIALRISAGAGAFAQHVIGMAVAPPLVLGSAIERLADGFAQHEMMAQKPHGLLGRGPDRRHAHALDQPAHHPFGRFTGIDHPRRHRQRPGRGRDEPGVAMGLVVAPAALLELVFDQPVLGQRIGDAEQCLGQHHQRQPFPGRQPVFTQEILDPAHLARVRADGLYQLGGARIDCPVLCAAEDQHLTEVSDQPVIIRGMRSMKNGQGWRFRGGHGTLP